MINLSNFVGEFFILVMAGAISGACNTPINHEMQKDP